ncbi:Protein of unknown function [Bacillus mycoides]|nr:Protein of unknown function [Bacillus mycoides]
MKENQIDTIKSVEINYFYAF